MLRRANPGPPAATGCHSRRPQQHRAPRAPRLPGLALQGRGWQARKRPKAVSAGALGQRRLFGEAANTRWLPGKTQTNTKPRRAAEPWAADRGGYVRVPAASCCLPVTTARLQTDEYKCSFRAATVVRMTPCKSMSDSSDPLPRDMNGEWPGGVPAVPAPLGQGSCARCQGRAVLGVPAEQPPLPIAGDRSCRLQLALETAQILCLQQQQAAELKKLPR